MWLNSYLLCLFIGLASPKISESLPYAHPGQNPDSFRLRGNGSSKMNLFNLNIIYWQTLKSKNLSIFSFLRIEECFIQTRQPWFSNSGGYDSHQGLVTRENKSVGLQWAQESSFNRLPWMTVLQETPIIQLILNEHLLCVSRHTWINQWTQQLPSLPTFYSA